MNRVHNSTQEIAQLALPKSARYRFFGQTRLITPLMAFALVSLTTSGCVEIAEVKLDAFIGMSTPGNGEDLGELAPLGESRLLHFQTTSGARALSISDQRLNTLCEAGSARLSGDAERMLCLPDSDVTPLQFIDRFSGSLIMSLGEWTESSEASPTLPRSGSAFASPIKIPEQIDHIAVYNDFAQEVGRIKSLTLHGFIGPDHLVINSPAEIWSFNAEPQGGLTIEEEEPEPVVTTIGTRDFKRHDFPPYGVLYDEQNLLYFLGVDQTASVKVGVGELIGIGERRAITLYRERGSPTKLNVYALDAEANAPALHSLDLPSGSFGQNYRAKMIGRNKVLFEAYRTRTCDDRVEYPVETLLIDLRSERVITINDSQEPHQVVVGGEGRFGLISYLDNCGRAMGTGELYDLREKETRALPEVMRGSVKEVAVSSRGGYLAVMSDDTVWLLDGSSLEHQVVLSNEQMVGALRFNP
jgi:hypothetical protein